MSDVWAKLRAYFYSGGDIPTLASGRPGNVRCDANAILLVNSGGAFVINDTTPSRYSSGGDARDGLIIAGAGKLREIKYRNTQAAATRYLMLFDLLALPANGTVPFWTASDVLADNLGKEAFNPKLPFTTGVYWAVSTTRATLTVGGATDMNVSALYEAP